MKKYDVIIIGGGPAGYVAAIRSSQLGNKTAIIENENLGGICLNWGCIPSKALIYAAGQYEKAHASDAIGIKMSDVSVDVDKMQDWKNGIVKKLTSGVKGLVKGNGADVAFGAAKLVSKNEVEVTDPDGKTTTYEATKGIIVATGAQIINIPGFEPDGETIVDARAAVSLQSAPESMMIVGGGVIGMELGMVYQKLGTKLTVVELMDQILPGTDKDLVKVVEKHFTKGDNPATVLTKSKAKSVTVKEGNAKVVVETDGKDQTFEVEKLLVCVGFRPNSKGLGLEEVGVKLDDRGHIEVNDKFETNVPGIYAIGDVTGLPYLAHKASKEGEIAAEVIAGHKGALNDVVAMPAAIFTDPEIATVGLTETAAKKAGKQQVNAELDGAGWTPVYWACRYGSYECLRHLLKWGADPRKANKRGWSPLFAAALHGHLDCVRFMLEDMGRRNRKMARCCNNKGMPRIRSLDASTE